MIEINSTVTPKLKAMYKVTLLFFILLTTFSIHSQDAQFTVFDQHSIVLNPAFTGDFGGNYDMRLSAQHRYQWKNALKGDEYNHTAISVESSNPLCVSSGQITLSFGGYFKDERFLSLRNPSLVNTKVAATAAVRLELGERVYASGGLEFGGVQRTLQRINRLQFGNQFNGMGGFDSQLSSSEAALEGFDRLSTKLKPDAGLGFAFVANPIGTFVFVLGGAAHHVNNPNLNFLTENFDDRIQRTRLTFNARLNVILENKVKLQVVNAYIQQGKGVWQSNTGVIFGGRFKDVDPRNPKHYISVGGGVRVTNPILTNDPITDVYGLVKYDHQRYSFSASVDIANSIFANGVNGNFGSTFECSFGLLIQDDSKRRQCKKPKCHWDNRSYNFRW